MAENSTVEPVPAGEPSSSLPSSSASAAAPSTSSSSAPVSTSVSASSSAASTSTGIFASDASVQSTKDGSQEVDDPPPTGSLSNPRTPELHASHGLGGDAGSFSPMALSPTYYDDYGGDFVIYNRMPLKEICLAIALLTFGMLGIVLGSYMAYNKVWGDRSHGLVFVLLGALLFIPGFHETRIAYFAWIGYKGFSFHSIPAV